MNNMYVPTKGGELIRLKRELARAGFSVPPFRIVQPPFEAKHGEIEAADAHFRKMTSNSGPFPPGLMVRNNGSPQGTGKGQSRLLLLSEPAERIAEEAKYSQESDKNAQGVILQLPVGQPMGNRGDQHFLPILSGIAYTAPASERGNAEVQWVPGHAAMAVAGMGEYVAFNEKSMEYEMKRVDLLRWKEPKMEDSRMPCISYLNYDCVRDKYDYSGGTWARHTIHDLSELGHTKQQALLESLFMGVLKLGKEGPLYLEWAMTCIGGKINLFALQVAEYAEKRAGLRTEVKEWTGNFWKTLKNAELGFVSHENGPEERALQELYEKAAQDERVLFAGFDVVGIEKREFDTLVWTNDKEDVKRLKGKNVAIVYDGYNITSRMIANTMPSVGGLVEEQRGGEDTFRGHIEGNFYDEDIIGIGAVEGMERKLLTLYPEKFDNAIMARTKMIGKFTMDVNAGIPFGTLRVDRLDSVERLRME